MDVSSYVGAPRLADPTPPPAGREVLFDALVGQINGRPVFASAFLDPLESRLLALQKDAPTRDQWLAEAYKIIYSSLDTKINDDLLLAEAYASLTPEMKDQGIRYFLGQIRGELVRQNSGSEQAADQRLREGAEGLSLDQRAKSDLHKELEAIELRRRVLPMVNVSSRDLQQYYEHNWDQFNPPGIATLRFIQVPSSDTDGVTKVTELLESGVPFKEVAQLPLNRFDREHGGLRECRVKGDLSEATFFKPAELNSRAVALKTGQTDGPFEYAGSTCWLHLEGIEHPPGISLYDAQLQIQSTLWGQKWEAAAKRYFDGLKRRGSYSDIKEMSLRLLQIAAQRYYGRGA